MEADAVGAVEEDEGRGALRVAVEGAVLQGEGGVVGRVVGPQHMKQDAQIPAPKSRSRRRAGWYRGRGCAPAGRRQGRGTPDHGDQVVEQVALGEDQGAGVGQAAIEVEDPGALGGRFGQVEAAGALEVVVVAVGAAPRGPERVGQGQVGGGVDVDGEGQGGEVLVQRAGAPGIGAAEVVHLHLQLDPARGPPRRPGPRRGGRPDPGLPVHSARRPGFRPGVEPAGCPLDPRRQSPHPARQQDASALADTASQPPPVLFVESFHDPLHRS